MGMRVYVGAALKVLRECEFLSDVLEECCGERLWQPRSNGVGLPYLLPNLRENPYGHTYEPGAMDAVVEPTHTQLVKVKEQLEIDYNSDIGFLERQGCDLWPVWVVFAYWE